MSDPTAQRLPPEQTKPYPVLKGETLAVVAHKHRMTMEELARLNGIQPSASLWPGQVLRVKAPTQAGRAPLRSASHVAVAPHEEHRLDIKQLDASKKLSLALQLSWRSWPGEIADVAKQSFSDPLFVFTLVGVMFVYVGLWVTPDPTLLTKVLAGALTVVLLAQFAWEDIYGLAKAWLALQDQCARARSMAELQAAGDTFAKKVGHVGFDLLLLIVMWRVGKHVEPKLNAWRARNAEAQATAKSSTAEARPGSGVIRKAQGDALKVLDVARTRAKSTDPARVLDALSTVLPEPGRRGLTHFRHKLSNDAQALAALESRLKKGEDLGSFLTHEGILTDQAVAAKAALRKARAELARARMMKNTLRDPLFRKAMREQTVSAFLKMLRSLKNPPDWLRIRENIKQRNIPDLVGELGEALQRSLLAEERPTATGHHTFANVEIVRLEEGATRIPEWQANQRANQLPDKAGGLYEMGGKLWKSITEVDALVAKKGPKGKWRPVELEQMKTGQKDKPSEARAQNQKALDAMWEIARGNPKIRLFERTSKNTLGRDITATFDLSALEQVTTATRGIAGKEFERNIPFSRELLVEVAEWLVAHGLPPEPAVLPVTSPPPSGQRKAR